MKYLRILLTLGFVSLFFAGAAQAGEKKEEGKSCGECSKDKCPADKKDEKKS
jgi:hypothetical protein